MEAFHSSPRMVGAGGVEFRQQKSLVPERRAGKTVMREEGTEREQLSLGLWCGVNRVGT